MSSNRPHQDKDVNPSQEAQALDSLGIVVGEIAHDFNNILSLIFGYVEMALSEIPEGQRARSDLEHVLAAGDRAKELVARILTYSNRAKLKKDVLDIRAPISSALKHLEDRLPPGIELHSDICSAGAAVLGNETEIFQIISNLCSNSLRALPDGHGEIRIKVRLINQNDPFHAQHPGLWKDSYVLVSVHDNGIGMDLSTQAKMYTPFFTTSRASNRSETRAGLGLTTVYNIVMSMEGLIFVQSAPGEGALFEICLPLVEARAVVNEPAAKLLAPGRDKHVLLIDDEPAITEMASHILTHSGYKVTLFNDGIEALQYFGEHPQAFDIVITDLIMPIISGSEVASRCAEINSNIPIILTTGFSEKISLADCRKWGVTAVVTKPFSIGQLLATLEELTKQ